MPGVRPNDTGSRPNQVDRPANLPLIASFYDDKDGNKARDGLISAPC
jgi:hypothetical protein